MDHTEFSEKSEALYLSIEEAIEQIIESDQVAIDYENNGGLLTIDCEDSNTKVIISRQPATQQIWVAARSGGFHCNYDSHLWRCHTTGETLSELLSRVCTEQSRGEVQFRGIE